MVDQQKADQQKHFNSDLRTDLCLWMIALKAKPSRQLVVKLRTLTLGYPAVFIWHHSNKASLADFVSLLSTSSIMMSWIWEGQSITYHYS